MTKRYIGFLLALCTLLTLCAPALAAEADGTALEAPEAPAFITEEEPIEEEPVAPGEPELAEPAEEPEEDVPAQADIGQPEPMAETDEPMTASSGSCGTNVTYTLSGGTLTISGKGAMRDYSIYSSSVAPWYTEKDQVRSVIIGEGVTSIGTEAFSGCASMTTFSLPSSLTTIGRGAFGECKSLTTVTIPDSVTNVGSGVFSFCTGLTSVRLSAGMTSVPLRTFNGCTNLRTVTMPSGTVTIGDSAFDGCVKLSGITIPSRVITIGPSAFQGCSALTSVTIPASVTEIGEFAFADCTGLTSVTFAGRRPTLGAQAFANTPWTENKGDFVVKNGVLLYYYGPGGSVTIPGSVTTIDGRVFTGRSDITAVTIPSSVRTIGDWAFAETGLRSVTIPSGVESVGMGAFYSCQSMASLSIAGTVKEIGQEAFCYCTALTAVTLPEGLKKIGSKAFEDCLSLHTVTIPSTVTSIDVDAFACDSLRKIIINGATFTYAHDDIPPAATVYGSGAGSARAYAAAMGLYYRDISQQHRNGWQSEGGSWYYYEDGRLMASRWLTDGGNRYYLSADGKMLTGLQRVIDLPKKAGLYYFDPGSGAMKVGWQQIGGKYYYFNPDPNADEDADKNPDKDPEQLANYGAAVRGWFAQGGDTFYLDPATGAMLVGWQNIGGKRYYFNTSHDGAYGARFTGRHQIGGTWYEFNSDGSLKGASAPPETPDIQPPAGGTGWRYVPETGDYYYFKDYVRKGDYWVGFADGASAWANNWYYADADGKLLTGFQYLDDLKGGKGWYMLQATDANGEIGKMLDGWQWTYTSAGTGYFSPKYGSQGLCTYTSAWGSYNAATGLWGDGLAHRG